jgi:hypothetical protein
MPKEATKKNEITKVSISKIPIFILALQPPATTIACCAKGAV